MESLSIVLLEPFNSGSHKQWAQGFKHYSQHDINILSLPGRHWKWRMHGGAISLAEKFQELGYKPDLIIATSMLDLSTFLSLTRSTSFDIPVALYMHENQINYPWSPQDRDLKYKRDNHYAFINYVSAITADCVLFNSHYHKKAFLDALPSFLNQFPDKRGKKNIEELSQKSYVLPIGVDFNSLDKYKPKKSQPEKTRSEIPTILWNHRWEFDKRPEVFFSSLFELHEKGIDFKLAVLGEQNDTQPEIFNEARDILSDHIVHFGFAENYEEYAKWLWQSDIIPVTSIHDFFGVSVVEAIYCGCYPLLPNRLAYPEHVPVDFLYEEGELSSRLIKLLEAKNNSEFKVSDSRVDSYNWTSQIENYDQTMSELVFNFRSK